MSKRRNSSVGNDMWELLTGSPVDNPPSPAGSSSAGQTSNPTPSLGFGAFSQPQPNYHYSQPPPNFHYQQPQPNYQYPQPPPNFHYQQPPPNFHYSQPPPNFQYQQPPPTTPIYSQNFQEPSPTDTQNVGDTQPEPTPSRKGKEKRVEKGKEKVLPKRAQTKWSTPDEVILAQRWIHNSEDGVKGNSKKAFVHWAQILEDFNSTASVKRNMNQLTGKWSKIAHDVKNFSAIYNSLNDMRGSGTRDEDVLKAARQQFRENVGRNFIYEDCWEVVRDSPKFYFSVGVMDTDPINLDEDTEPASMDPGTAAPRTSTPANMHALFQDDPLRRPPGRSLSKKSQKTSSSSDAASSRRSIKQDTLDLVRKTSKKNTGFMKKVAKMAHKKLILETWKFLATKVPNDLDENRKQLLENAQEEIAQQFHKDLAIFKEVDEEGDGDGEGSGAQGPVDEDEDEEDDESLD